MPFLGQNWLNIGHVIWFNLMTCPSTMLTKLPMASDTIYIYRADRAFVKILQHFLQIGN